jgi:hypothetical protein
MKRRILFVGLIGGIYVNIFTTLRIINGTIYGSSEVNNLMNKSISNVAP